jgi:integrase
MARQRDRLTALKVGRLKAPGLYADGAGLYLQIKAAGARSWVFRYRMGGRKTPRDMGLGSAADVSLAGARLKADACRDALRAGIDPIDARKRADAAAALDAAKAISFKDCATAFIASQKDGWRNSKHAAQWTATLEAYAFPSMGKLPVAEIGIEHVLKVLEQPCADLSGKPTLWKGKTETASRVRGRIEAILDWAKVRNYRAGENPARWRGNLQHSLPKRGKVQKVKHHAALPYGEIGAFVQALRAKEGTAARALEFLILTTARTSEVTGARWREIDLDAALWTVPADRIKGGKLHRVPLSASAVAVLEAQFKAQGKAESDAFVFPGGKAKKPLSENAMLALLTRMKRDDLTAHGFRSSFRDWAAEQTNYPREAAEMALAHVVSDKVEAAYRRGDLFEKRRRLMDDWAKFCTTVVTAGSVVPINRAARKR